MSDRINPNLITVNHADGNTCCASTDPELFCPECRAAYDERTKNVIQNSSDLCSDSMSKSELANRASAKAERTGDPEDHRLAAARHGAAWSAHQEAAGDTDRDDEARDAHAMLASHHRDRFDVENDLAMPADESEPTGNTRRVVHIPRAARQALDAAEHGQRRRSQRQLVSNRRPTSRQQGLLVPPDMATIMGLDRGVTVNTAAAGSEFLFNGSPVADPNLLIPPTLNFDDRSSYPKRGVRQVPPLTSGRPRVKPSVPAGSRSAYEGQDTGSYPRYGNTTLGESDSSGDDYEDGRGSRSNRGKPAGGYFPDPYGYQPPVEDRTAGQQGIFRQNGKSMYSEDFWRRQTDGEVGRGANPLPQDASGQSYTRSPTQDADENRRRFGNQRTLNFEMCGFNVSVPVRSRAEDREMLIPPVIDWQDRVEEIKRTGR